MSATDSLQRPTKVMRLRDDDFLAALLEKRECALDLGTHATRGKVPFVEIAPALGHIHAIDVGLLEDRIWIEDQQISVRTQDITVGPRIGIDYAEEDAKRPYRFRIAIRATASTRLRKPCVNELCIVKKTVDQW